MEIVRGGGKVEPDYDKLKKLVEVHIDERRRKRNNDAINAWGTNQGKAYPAGDKSNKGN